jgi:hypothetical protein
MMGSVLAVVSYTFHCLAEGPIELHFENNPRSR